MERSRDELSREKFMGRRRVPAPRVNRSFAGTEACKQKREEKNNTKSV